MQKIITKAPLFALFISLFCVLSFKNVNAQTTVSANTTISQDTAWDGLVIIDGARVTVEQNATLTLEPGTIVSAKNGASIYVMGKLKALGNGDEKIRWTAEENEKPNFSLNYYIDSTTASEINLENFILEDGGGNQDTASLPALVIRGKASLSKGMVRRNLITAVRVWSSDVQIEDCEIYENENVAVENKSTTNVLKAENNWWGSEDGPTTTSIPNSPRALVKGVVDFDPWQKKGPIPIVILPGFGLSFSFKLLSEKAKDDWWLPTLGTSAYRYFAKALVLSNYFHDKDFFWGFYDWRMSCEDSAKRYLQKVIDEAKEKSGHSQVHIVAHSMGGLVARSYAEGDDFRDDIDHLIAVGTPHLGSSEVYPIWEGGKMLDEKKPIYVYLWYLEALNWDWNRMDFIRKNFPSLGQMMPIYDYLVNGSNDQPIPYKNQKEKNEFLEDLSDPAKIKDLRRKVNIGLVLGSGQRTLEKIKVTSYEGSDSRWKDGIPDPLDPPEDTDSGDGTVTSRSAGADNELAKNTIVIDSSHSQLLKEGTKPIFDQLKVRAKFPLLFKVMSRFLLTSRGPVDVEIQDDSGKVIGFNEKETPDSQYHEQEIEGKKLVFASFPLDLASGEEKSIRVILTGKSAGNFRAAFWNFSAEDDYSKQEIDEPIEEGVRLIYEIKFGQDNNGLPEISVEREAASNLLRIDFPQSSKEYLNWKKIKPAASLWQGDNYDLSDTHIAYRLDEKPLEDQIDPGELTLGNHFLEASADYKFSGQAQNEEKEITFSVTTSSKSLMTLINRFYEEEKITDWNTRSRLINLLAEACQETLNGSPSNARTKIVAAEEIIDSSNENVFSQEETKGRLEESLKFLEHNPH